ncbi:resistance-nodulation-cell division multidrug efflux membrane fusion protein MexE [Thalassotalea loyana]|uniref:Resistance-nodulation-cell division multidrug efflux membrane fusion protein MexE n=1 Tax=Thalassotalea loyana TaxID=280483 RepID=A0ABQ6HBX4_9GAMM|nr:efflux RND transporter periplasmic adaptor subunit [Thalassotalea loyana]GLX85484.1 resistance-nodulation-cell division multidrug efflux membrane fusion protein MexE [Thalassotalea loyana]
MKKSILGFSVVAALLLAGCQGSEGNQTAVLPQVPIDVAQVAFEEVQSWHTYTTRLESPEFVTLSPRVSGTIVDVAFAEGQVVQEGDLLFQIDPRPFQAEVSRIKAQISSAEAALEQAQNREERVISLGRSSAISQEEIESRISVTKQRHAELLALKAELESASLNLEFTRVISPITGLVSSAYITKGNTVTANQSVLTNIVSTDKMYAYFDVDERTWNKDFSQVSASSHLPVSLELVGNNSVKTGQLDFIDNIVNPTTGTIRVRAAFDTTKNKLKAGSFARVKISSTLSKNKVLIPERAVGTDLKNQYVLVLSKDNTLQYRNVELGDRFGKYRAVESGLSAKDVIAVNGPAKVGPGMQVLPRNVSLDLSAVTLKQNQPEQSHASLATALIGAL